MILHVDMDAFFAAVEQRDFPELRGKPVLVGGAPDQRGVVAAASYEARPFGVRSAMPMSQAVRLCPHAIIRRGRYHVYRQVSSQIRQILGEFSPLVEPLALDEAFLDVSGCERSLGDAVQIGREIKRRIAEECRLVASVGIAPVKFVAKLASDEGKPDGFVVVSAAEVLGFLHPLSVRRLWGVGKATAERLERLGIRTIGQLRQTDVKLLEDLLGSQGRHLWELAHGIDPRPVQTGADPKSISHETTFPRDVTQIGLLLSTLHSLTEQVCSRLRHHGMAASGVTIKVRWSDFRTITRSAHWQPPSDSTRTIWEHVKQTWNRLDWQNKPVRLLGVGVTGLSKLVERQPSLFDEESDERERRIDRVADEIRQRFGLDSLRPADTLPRSDRDGRRS